MAPVGFAGFASVLMASFPKAVRRVLDPGAFLADAAARETLAFNREFESWYAEFPPAHVLPVDEVRAKFREGGGLFPSFGPLPGSRWLEIPGAPDGPGRLRVSEPEGEPAGVYVHIHGGGWTLGAADDYDAQNQALAARAGIVVASVDYRLAPENPWPAAGDDCAAALGHVLENSREKFGTERVAIGGESAGAHLAAATLQRCRETELSRIAGAILTYGCYDLRLTPSMRNWGDRQLILSTPTVEWFVGNLLANRFSPGDPAVSPLLGDLTGMPPALFSVGTEDPLIDDSLFLANRWAAAGSEAELAVYPGAIHAFDLFDLAVAREFRANEAAFLARCLSRADGAQMQGGDDHG